VPGEPSRAGVYLVDKGRGGVEKAQIFALVAHHAGVREIRRHARDGIVVAALQQIVAISGDAAREGDGGCAIGG